MSPRVKKIVSEPSAIFNYEESFIKKNITGKVADHFQKVFSSEF